MAMYPASSVWVCVYLWWVVFPQIARMNADEDGIVPQISQMAQILMSLKNERFVDKPPV
jgi:hypothetical protein